MITPEDLNKYPFNLLKDAYKVTTKQTSTFCRQVTSNPEPLINKIFKSFVDSFAYAQQDSCRRCINAIIDHYKYNESYKVSCKENVVSQRTYQNVVKQLFAVLNKPSIRNYMLSESSQGDDK